DSGDDSGPGDSSPTTPPPRNPAENGQTGEDSTSGVIAVMRHARQSAGRNGDAAEGRCRAPAPEANGPAVMRSACGEGAARGPRRPGRGDDESVPADRPGRPLSVACVTCLPREFREVVRW